MFQIWDKKGVPTPYEPGSVKVGRVADRKQIELGAALEREHTPQTPDPSFTTAASQLSYTLVNPYQRISLALERREPVLKAEQIMNSPVLSVEEDATFAEALELIESHRFRHLPVVSRARKLVGIISDRDLLRRSANAIGAQRARLAESLVRDVMHGNVLSTLPDTEIRHIARVMFEERIGSMLIVNEKHQLEGILTRSDILRAVVAKGPEELWM